MQAASIPSWQDLGVFHSRIVISGEVKVPVCLLSQISVLSVSEKADSNSFAAFLS